MPQRLSQLALLVDDYDEAIRFYVGALGWELREDTPLTPEKRWVRVGPAGGAGAGLLLARAAGERQRSRIGDQTGGRVFLFLQTDAFDADHARLLAHGARIVRPPEAQPWGRTLVFADLYGNLWDLIERPTAERVDG